MHEPKKPTVTDATDEQNNQSSTQSSDRKTKNTTPTLYPDIEFINRTLP